MAAPVIIYRLGSMGDTVVALPCFRKIAEVFSDRRRMVLTNVPVASNAAALDLMLRPSGLIDEIIDYPVGVRSPRLILDLARRIRATGADTLIYLSAPRGGGLGVARDLVFFRLCGLRTIIGAPSTADLRDHRPDPDGQGVEPEAERLVRNLARLGPIDLDDRASWDLSLTPGELSVAERSLAPLFGQPFFAINVGGKQACNDWGQKNWIQLMRELGPILGGYAVLSVGAKDDAARSAAILTEWPGLAVNLCGDLTPRETAAVLGHARFFIGHDSGPMHLAASVGTSTVGIFGDNFKPRVWHPYGPGHRPIHDIRGVHMVSVEQIRLAVLAVEARRS